MDPVIIAGGAMTPFNRRKDGSSWRDWARQAFEAALADANLERPDIDSLVVASESDFFTLQLNPASVLADDLALFGKPVMRVEGGGASGHLAVQAAVMQVLSGQAARVAVLGVEALAAHLPGATVSTLYGLSFDAWTDGMTGIDSTALYALSALAFQERTGASESDFAAVAVRNRDNACDNKFAHLPLEISVQDVLSSPMISAPYHRLDCSPLSDGAACLIVGRGVGLPHAGRDRARLVGMGAANDRVRLGERTDPGYFGAKQIAAARAIAAAGGALSDIDIAEVYDSYSGAQLQAIEALGLSDQLLADERAGRFAALGSLPVNLSGGLLGQGAPVGATGVAQVLTIARQLEGRYWGRRPDRTPRRGLVDTHGGIATLCAVSIVEAP
ncbi:thiolase family protein [Devosia neptuniae]|jgi:acetyl-CoA C-acetyltransferase|uniref:thiolase family protein n=1 Tax=Devosia TaxID=46913 RepID=UPI0022AFAC53|nr:thiolase family protein [Devosia neptuniae]MCZ4346814.1 thiolase family protein [Devosia neptuniae]